MHGMIFGELKKYVETNYPLRTWQEVLVAAGLGTKTFYSVQLYPDEEAVALVTAVAKKSGKSIDNVLEEFGDFISGSLLNMYKGLIKPEWTLLDLLENTEAKFHAIVIKRHGAEPPKLECKRISPDEVLIIYGSHRKMCRLAVGVIHGFARHFKQKVIVYHKGCMLMGATHCELVVKLDKK